MKNLLFIAFGLLLFFVNPNLVQSQPVNTLVDIGLGNAVAMSPNGAVVVGEDGWYWTYETGQVYLEGDVETNDVTNDTMIVGSFRDPSAITPDGDTSKVAGYWKNGVWTALGQMPGVPYFDYDLDEYSEAEGVSGDGVYIVGKQKYDNGDFEAWKWRADSGYTLLGHRYRGSRALNVCDDGSIVVGWDEMENGPREAVYWTPAMNFINPGQTGEAVNITADGTYIIGQTDDYAFRWSEAGGLENLLADAGKTWGYAVDISDDGSVIGGGEGGSGVTAKAFVWTEDGGFQYLEDYLESYGVVTLGWTFHWVTGVSADGTILSGYATKMPGPELRSFWVKLEGPSAVETKTALTPIDFVLEQNYPNPFNPMTTIRYYLKKESRIKLIVLDIRGRKIRTLVSEVQSPGEHLVHWQAEHLPSGIYVYKLEADGFTQSRKAVLLK